MDIIEINNRDGLSKRPKLLIVNKLTQKTKSVEYGKKVYSFGSSILLFAINSLLNTFYGKNTWMVN